MFTQGHRVMGKLELLQSFYCKVAWSISNVHDGWLREMTVKKFWECGEYGWFEHVLFLQFVCFCLFVVICSSFFHSTFFHKFLFLLAFMCMGTSNLYFNRAWQIMKLQALLLLKLEEQSEICLASLSSFFIISAVLSFLFFCQLIFLYQSSLL